MQQDNEEMEKLLKEAVEEEQLDLELVHNILEKEEEKAPMQRRSNIFNELRVIIRDYVDDHGDELEQKFEE